MRRAGLIVVGMIALAMPAAAQDAGPSSGWIVELGSAARVRPMHLGSRAYTIDAVTIAKITWNDRLTLSLDDGAKWTLAKYGPLSLGPVAEYREAFNDDLPPGAFHTHDTVELGGFGQIRTPIGPIEGRLRRAVNGYGGWSGDLTFDTGANVTPNLELGGQLRVAWADSSFTQEYFGLQPRAARRIGLPRFLDEDYVTVGGELDLARNITPHARVVLSLSADRVVGEQPASPLSRDRNVFIGALGVTYRWSPRRRKAQL